MNWVDVTPAQRAAAEHWWESRTPAEIERDWPSPRPYSHRSVFAHTAWRVFGSEERCSIAIKLMDAGLICEASQGRLEDAALQVSTSGRDDKAIPLRRVPRLTESGNGLYVRVGGRR